MNALSLPAYAFGGYMEACRCVSALTKIGQGLFVCTRTVEASTTSTRSMGLKFELPRMLESLHRSMLNFTDSALKSSPLWNLTPRRSLNSHVVGATSLGISAASAGTSLRLWSRSRSASNIWAPTLDAGCSCWFAMSRVVGSTPWAITTLPAGAAAAASGDSAIEHSAMTVGQWRIGTPPRAIGFVSGDACRSRAGRRVTGGLLGPRLQVVEVAADPRDHRREVGGDHDEVVPALDRPRREGPARAVHARLLPVLVRGVPDLV